MKPIRPLRLLNYLWLLLVLCRCDCTKHDPTPEAQLPAETQAGKNTFGCLVNGKVWLPRPSLGLAIPAGVDLSYDPTFDGGTMSLKARNWYRDATDSNIGTTEYIDIGLGQVSKPGQYSLNPKDQQGTCNYFLNTQQERDKTSLKACGYDDPNDQSAGTLTITKLDVANQIIAGRFEFTLTKSKAQTGCDSVVRVTNGRFDMKF